MTRSPVHCEFSASISLTAYDFQGRQQHVERVLRGLKGGDWVGWGPMHHWTDSKIRVHAFYCLLGVSLVSKYSRASLF